MAPNERFKKDIEMKTQMTLAVLALMVGSSAFAKGNAKPEVISGQEAQKRITSFSSIDPANDFEGDDCVIQASLRGHNMELTFTEKGKKVLSLEIFEDTKYKYSTHDKGDDSVFTISTLNGKNSITVENASDAFTNISAAVDGVTSSCEVDM